MDVVAINIAGKESVHLMCSKCGSARDIQVSSLSNIGRVFKVKCKCTHGFSIAFDNRKFRRKKTKFLGSYSLDNSIVDNMISIVDLSRGGLGFIRSDNTKLAKGDRISIRFRLDNAECDLIATDAIIRNVFDDRVCVEFIDMKGRMNTTLGFYFM